MLDESKTHWIVMWGSHFTGNEYPKERRKTRKGAFNALRSMERFIYGEEEYLFVIRNDIPNEKWY